MINLIQGDCLEVMKTIEDNSIDAIITDPPYGTTACKWDSVIDFELMWEQLNRIIKPNGAIVLFGSEPFSSALRMSNIKNYKYDWIWEKHNGSNSMLCKKQPLNFHENISLFYKKQPVYNPQMWLGKANHTRNDNGLDMKSELMNTVVKRTKTKTDGIKYPRRIIKFNSIRQNKQHPTEKPVALMEYLIKTYTNENETVLDFTMGSGSTGVAAKNLNRSFIGIEQDENYFEIAKERIGE
jgi:DNA modification methylase